MNKSHWIKLLSNFDMTNFSKRKQLLALFFLCSLFIIINISSLFFPLTKSLTYDESYHYLSGVAILSGKPSKRGETNVSDRNIMPVSALNPLFSKFIRQVVPSSFISKFIPESDDIFLGKSATIIISLILAIYIFCWSRDLYGVNAGFFAILLYIFDPNIIAHSRLVTQDIFGACFVFISVYHYWKFLYLQDKKNGCLSMIAFGIAQVSRYTSVYLLPIYFILTITFYSKVILNLTKIKKTTGILIVKNLFIYIVSLLLTTILIINIGFSFERTFTKLGDYKFESQSLRSLQSNVSVLRELPVPVPYAYLRGLDMGKYKQETGFGSAPAYLQGIISKKGFKKYFIIAFKYKVPIATQIFLLIAVISLFRYKYSLNFWQNEAFLVFPSIVFFVALSFSSAQLGIRYIIMILPFLFVFSSRILLGFKDFNNKYKIFIFSLICYLAISSFSYFPHYLSYFNELLVDRKLGYTILADSNLDWGQNQYYLKHYLQENENAIYLDYEYGQGKPKLFNHQGQIKPQNFKGGLVIINANQIVGISSDPKNFQWLRKNKRPIAQLGYNYLLFEITPLELTNLLME